MSLEFAEYTSAQERVPLGKKSKKIAASKRKEVMQEMIEDAYVIGLGRFVIHLLIIFAERKKTTRRWNGNKSSFDGAVILLMTALTQRLPNKYIKLPQVGPHRTHLPLF